MYKKGFTLVELLAVIIVLAVILVIAIPKIGDMIGVSRENAFITNVESMMKLTKIHYQENYASSLASSNVVYNISDNKIKQNNVDLKLSSKVGDLTGTIIINSDGETNVTMQNSNYCATKTFGGKLSVHSISNGTCEGYADAVEYLTQKYNNGTNSEGLIQTNGTELRYQGADPNNYVYFNCTDNLNPTSSTCEVWRIVGVFDGRVKLVRKDRIGIFSLDTSESTINSGYGINQWGVSGTYEGADLMRELNSTGEFANTGYLSTSLSANANWYNGSDNSLGDGNFNKDYVLKASTQELIGEAIWYMGGIKGPRRALADAYAAERGEQVKICTSETSGCNDNVERIYTWIGKVGLIYPSDFGYASGNSNCATNITFTTHYCVDNWMKDYGWTFTPDPAGLNGYAVWYVRTTSDVNYGPASARNHVRPSIYLIPGIQIKGSGTTSDPYSFA